MADRLNDFMKPLKESLFSLKDYVDFPKVAANVEAISIKLNQLNYLIGQEDMAIAVERLWEENPKVFSVLDILIAVRTKDKKKAIDENGNILLISDYFTSPEQVTKFINYSGLTEVFRKKQIRNLVDYVFGVEVGLDSNARKNRGGEIMQNLVRNILKENNIEFSEQVSVSKLSSELKKSFGKKRKVFDFVVKGISKTWLLEVNFYAIMGSKINETASSYIELQNLITRVPGFDFVWVTDGTAWLKEHATLSNAVERIKHLYNLYSFETFAPQLKH